MKALITFESQDLNYSKYFDISYNDNIITYKEDGVLVTLVLDDNIKLIRENNNYTLKFDFVNETYTNLEIKPEGLLIPIYTYYTIKDEFKIEIKYKLETDFLYRLEIKK